MIPLTLLQLPRRLYNYITLFNKLRRKITTVSKPTSSLLWGNSLKTSINEILFRKMAIGEAVIIPTEVGFHLEVNMN